MKAEYLVAVVVGAMGVCGVGNATVAPTQTAGGDAIRARQPIAVDKIGHLAELVNKDGIALQIVSVEDGLATVQFVDAQGLAAAVKGATVKIDSQPAAGGLFALMEGRCPPGAE